MRLAHQVALTLALLLAAAAAPAHALQQLTLADSARAHRRAQNVIGRHMSQVCMSPVLPKTINLSGYAGIWTGGTCSGQPGHRPWFARNSRPLVIEELTELREQLPGDDWIVGQLVGMYVEHGDLDSAGRTAATCLGSEWWCAALVGFVLHELGNIPLAEAAFDRALETMPLTERCRWLELLPLIIEGDLRRSAEEGDCEQRIALEKRIWWLANPLFLFPANDRRSEHYTRLVAIRLENQAIQAWTPFSVTADPQFWLIRIREGYPPYWWSLEWIDDMPRIEKGYRFIPRSEPGLRPLETVASDWALLPVRNREIRWNPNPGFLRSSRSPTSLPGARPTRLPSSGPAPTAGIQWLSERYDPPYGPIWDLDQQVAFFRRGDSVQVAAATELAKLRLAVGGSIHAGLALSRNENEPPIVVRDEGIGSRYHFRVTVPADRYLVSVEAYTEERGAARTRYGHGLQAASAAEPALSDLLLFEWTDSLEQSLDVIAPRMLGTSKISAGRETGIFWEMYGLAAGDLVEVSVAATRRSEGILGAIGRAIRVGGREEVMRVTWEELVDEGNLPAMGRTLETDLSRLPRGGYTLELSIRAPDGASAVAHREFDVVR